MVLEETGRETIEACQRGETDAFRALFEANKDKVYTVAFRFSGDASQAQDIAQEVFLKLFSAIGSFRGEQASFQAWLYRLVVNSCLDQRRRTRRFLPVFDSLLDLVRAPDLSALEEILRSETSANLHRALAGLPAPQRMMVVLRYSQGLSYGEIGELLDCPAGTVASRLNRIHNVLARRLARLAGGG